MESSGSELSGVSFESTHAAFRRIVDSNVFGVAIGTFDGRIGYANDRLLDMLGFTRLEADQGDLRWDRLTLPEYRAADERATAEVMATGACAPYEKKYFRKDGTRLSVIVWTARIDGPEGDAIAFYIDQTEREDALEALRASEERYRALMANSSEGIWLAELDDPIDTALPEDEQIRLIYERAHLAECNDVMAQMYGYQSSRELIGARIEDLMPSSNEKNVEYLREFIRSGYCLTGAESQEVDRLGNQKVFVNNLVARPEEGLVYRAWGTQRDVTDQRRWEDAMKQLNEELERRVRERTEELEAANKELESFCYSVSHDLRAPLRAVMGSSMILLEDYAEKLDKDGQSTLNRMAAAAKQMSQLIEDILQMSRLQRAEVSRQPINVGETVRSVIAELKPLPGKTVDYAIEPGLEQAVVDADPRLFRVVLTNLLENAQKFSANQAAPRIAVGVQQDGPDRAFYVRDNGVGFNMEYEDKLWLPFERLHRADEYPGTGVGLANVKRILERHGGKIWAESEEGRGATFFFTL